MTENLTWIATAIQAGTNERMRVTAPTLEQAKTKLFGQAYGPVFGTDHYYTIPRSEAAE